jgi:sugar lactone lactonase YvrE
MSPSRIRHLSRALTLAAWLAPGIASGPVAAQDYLDIEIFTTVAPPGSPEGIAVAPDGTVYVGTGRSVSNSDPFPSVLFAYDSAGQLVNQWTIEGQNQTNSGLTGIALDGDGAVYALDADPPRVLRIHPPTGVQTTYATFHDVLPCSGGGAPGDCSAGTIDQASTPNFPVFAADGTLYVTDSAQGLIWRVPPGGGEGEVWFTDPALEGIFGPNGIQFRSDGTTLLFALTGYQGPEVGFATGRLYELPVLQNGDPGAMSLFWTSQPVDGPDGFSIAASGNVYVALAGTNQLAVIGPTGSEVARVPETPAENAMLEVPMDMPASTGFLGNRLLMTNQSLFTGNSNSWVVYDITADEPGLPLFYPLPEPGAGAASIAGATLLVALNRQRAVRTA